MSGERGERGETFFPQPKDNQAAISVTSVFLYVTYLERLKQNQKEIERLVDDYLEADKQSRAFHHHSDSNKIKLLWKDPYTLPHSV
jgi:hypothetical protein